MSDESGTIAGSTLSLSITAMWHIEKKLNQRTAKTEATQGRTQISVRQLPKEH